MTSEHEYTPTEDEWRDATTYSLCDWWVRFETTDERDLAWARFIAQVKAEAWDEGHSWGWSDAQDAHDVRQIMGRADWPQRTPNPYREDGNE